jgi:SpoVK/Ycf46/Vps4 family AAA+-type ATPase
VQFQNVRLFAERFLCAKSFAAGMGSYISKWRRKPSTVEVLEKLDKDIVRLERLKQTDTEQQKRIVASLVLYSVIFYVVAALTFYFYFMPTLWFDRVLYSLPLLIFPLLVWLLKRFLHWYYVKRIQKNDDALEKLKQKKKEILEEVMEKETYKKAKEILEKFAPTAVPPAPKSPASADNRPGEQQLRQRMVPPGSATTAAFRPPLTPSLAAGGIAVPPSPAPNITLHSTPVYSIQRQIATGRVPGGPSPHRLAPPGPPLPRPVLPRERSMLDRMMEYLIGDGPQNRYALICAECSSHNGMALREEFEYISFRCCYCYHVNLARKQKPRAPSLEDERPPVVPQPDLDGRTVSSTEDVITDGDESVNTAAEGDEDADNVTKEMDVDDAVETVEPSMTDEIPIADASTTDNEIHSVGTKKTD